MKRHNIACLYRQIRGGTLTLERSAGSIFLGLFVGLLPLYGLHLPLCLGLALRLKLDGLLAYAAANISNPLLAPFIVALEIQAGSLLFQGHLARLSVDEIGRLGLAAFTMQSIVGAIAVALIGASLGALVTLGVGSLYRKGRARKPSNASEETHQRLLERYNAVRAQDRLYVRIKLATDPLAAQLAAMEAPLGSVVDVGCGRGQFGLLLRIMGKATALYGFDWDPNKILSAQKAADNLGRFVVADLNHPPLETADTFLLFDVLHYLAEGAQQRLLEQLHAHLVPGGRLLMRDVAKNRGLSGFMTRSFEYLGTSVGMNRSQKFCFRSGEAVISDAIALGFVLETTQGCAKSLLDNQLYVLRKPISTSDQAT